MAKTAENENVNFYYIRATAPGPNNAYYVQTAGKGYSKCIKGNNKKGIRPSEYSVLPNCVGYAWGRFNEIAKTGKNFSYYYSGNAGELYGKATANGLTRGTTPRVCAMICWSRDGGVGHVGIVERIIDDKTIEVSMSGWSSNVIWNKRTFYKDSSGGYYESKYYNTSNGYLFQGFIYQPKVYTYAGRLQEDDAFSTNVHAQGAYEANPSYAADTIDSWKSEYGHFQWVDSSDLVNAQLAKYKKNTGSNAQLNARNFSGEHGMDLLSAACRVESPFITVDIAGYTFGSYISQGNLNGVGAQKAVHYPNYMKSINIIKTNGTLNVYTLEMVYQIAPGEDPNLLDKIFSKVAGTRAITLSYGDWENPSFVFRKEEAIITNVTSRVDFAQQSISYTIECTSKALKAQATAHDFPSYTKKASSVIKDILLKDNQYGLLDVFPGMRNKQAVANAGLIPGDDRPVKLEAQKSISPLDYLNYVVACMTSATSGSGTIKDATYHLVVMDDTENQFGGAYFKVVKVNTSSASLAVSDMFEVEVGYPGSALVTDFQITTDNGYSILYNYDDSVNLNSYVYTIDNNGKIRSDYVSTGSVSAYYNRSTEMNKNWWTKMTQFPITATMTLKGLLRPAMLMTYVKVYAYFYGRPHISSGIYIITKQEDSVSESGYRTTLSLTRIATNADIPMNFTQTSTPASDDTTPKSTNGNGGNSDGSKNYYVKGYEDIPPAVVDSTSFAKITNPQTTGPVSAITASQELTEAVLKAKANSKPKTIDEALNNLKGPFAGTQISQPKQPKNTDVNTALNNLKGFASSGKPSTTPTKSTRVETVKTGNGSGGRYTK